MIKYASTVDQRHFVVSIWITKLVTYCSSGGRRHRDRMLVGFTKTYAISAYHEVYNIM